MKGMGMPSRPIVIRRVSMGGRATRLGREERR